MIETSLPGGLERRREDYKLITGLGHYVDDAIATLSLTIDRSFSRFG